MNLIERNAKVGFGQPVIAGRRLTVFSVVTYASYSDRITDFLKDFELSIEELKSAVSYCKLRECNVILNPTDKFCDGCIMRSISEGWKSVQDDFVEIDGVSISKDGKTIALSTLGELEESEFGIMGWLVAEEVEKKIALLDDSQM